MPKSGFTTYSKIKQALAHEFNLVESYKNGYRNREDDSILPPDVMVNGSHDVMTNVYGRIGIRKGYILDGTASINGVPIVSSYDWQMHTGAERNLRTGFLTSAGNDGKLQYRYLDTSGNSSWRDLKISLTSVSYQFCDYWDTTLNQSKLLMVSGGSEITEWTGGITTYSSNTSNTITKEGVETWAEIGFYTTGTHKITILGVDYTATGGWGTTTLTGVTPDPTGAGIVVGDIIHQTTESTLNSAMTSAPSGFKNDLIANLRNQIYLGCLTINSIYISKINNYKDFGFTSPTRIVGEGAIVTPDGTPKAFISQEDRMYISVGKDQWYETKFTLSSDLTKETFEISKLKTASLQTTKSQGLTSKIDNSVIFVSNEPIIRSLGLVENIYTTPQLTDLSYSVVNLINSLDFTDGQIIFHKNFIYISAPKSSTVLIYNMTDPNNHYWEPPQTLPIGRFSIINGELYGHSYLTSETYKLFTGFNDNNHPMKAKVLFSSNPYGTRPTVKNFTKYYMEGYISSNTTLTLGLQYNTDGWAVNTKFDLDGSDKQVVAIAQAGGSLGKESLGKNSLGGDVKQISTLPPKFKCIKTFNQVPFYEVQPSFSSQGINQNWELLAFGAALNLATEQNVPIQQ